MQTHGTSSTSVPAPAAPVGDSASRSRPTRTLRILLAEDNAVNQRLAVRLLERQGHAVTVVDTGCAALAAVSRERFDIVLMDVQMPQMDGLAATAAIRAAESLGGGRVPIVAMTGTSSGVPVRNDHHRRSTAWCLAYCVSAAGVSRSRSTVIATKTTPAPSAEPSRGSSLASLAVSSGHVSVHAA